MQKNNNRLQRAVDIHLDSVNVHNDLGGELVSLMDYVETLDLKKEEKEILSKRIESCKSTLFGHLDYVIQYSFENMNEIETES